MPIEMNDLSKNGTISFQFDAWPHNWIATNGLVFLFHHNYLFSTILIDLGSNWICKLLGLSLSRWRISIISMGVRLWARATTSFSETTREFSSLAFELWHRSISRRKGMPSIDEIWPLLIKFHRNYLPSFHHLFRWNRPKMNGFVDWKKPFTRKSMYVIIP